MDMKLCLACFFLLAVLIDYCYSRYGSHVLSLCLLSTITRLTLDLSAWMVLSMAFSFMFFYP